MQKSLLVLTSSVLLIFMHTFEITAQTIADPLLLAEINKIKAIDNHAHPLRFTAEGEQADNEYDALPLDSIEQSNPPIRLRPDNLEYIGAWHTLYNYSFKDMTEVHLQTLTSAKRRVMHDKGSDFPVWVLDNLGIEIMLANRVAMGRGLTDKNRFRWVCFADALMFPLNNEAAGGTNSDQSIFYKKETLLRERYLSELNIKHQPTELNEYLTKVITPWLEKQKREGAVAIKFEVGYLRSLDFSEVNQETANRVYALYAKSGKQPTPTDYKLLQDFLFRYISREAGRFGLAVHIHVADGGGGYYQQSGSNPLLLDSVFNDPTLRKTNFVILHGGGLPFYKQTASLMSKPNVYADFSAMTFLLYPRALSEVLRTWLEYFPEKVLFGTDAFAITPEVSWEEVGWLSNTTARKALAIALTDMMRDKEITRPRALELARVVMRENAIKLYGLK